MKISTKYIFIVAVAVLFFSSPVFALLPDSENMKKLLAYNEGAIAYLNVCISNLPPPEKNSVKDTFSEDIWKRFEKSLKHDYKAKIWYMQGNYPRTYTELMSSQSILKDIYKDILIYYIDGTHSLLENSIPLTIRSYDSQAKYYITQGYNFLGDSRNLFLRGYNTNPSLHTNQMVLYREGIAQIRMGRRYALLAMIESRLPPSEKPKLEKITIDMVKAKKEGKQEKPEIFDWVKNKIINLTGRKLLPRSVSRKLLSEKSLEYKPKSFTLNILEVHQDNFNKILTNRKSAWLVLLEKIYIEMDVDEPYYPERNSKNIDMNPKNRMDEISKPVQEKTIEPAQIPSNTPTNTPAVLEKK